MSKVIKKYKAIDYLSYFVNKTYRFSKSYYLFWFNKIDKTPPRYFFIKYFRHVFASLTSIASLFLLFRYLIPSVFIFFYDAFAFNIVDKQASYTFSKTEEVQSKDGQFRTFACKKFPCEAQVDSVEFRIRDSLYMDVVWLFTKGQPYDPAELAGAFLSEQNECDIRYYGRRFKYFGTYPKIISAKCNPVQKGNKND